MQVVLFNGPPRCGKDTAAKFLLSELHDHAVFDRMSMPIKRAFAGAVAAEINQFGDVKDWEDFKDSPAGLLSGKSYRQWQIEFSEKFMKPMYGEDIFARLFAQRNETKPDNATILVPDCGFQIELDGIRKYMPEATIVLVRIHRWGCNFDNDSRSYLYDERCRYVELYNDGSMEELFATLRQLVEHGWIV